MDYKKKYEDALKRAKDVHTYYCDDNAQLRKIESIFPELAESEGERMVKFIKKQLFNIKKTITENYELDAKLTKAIEWLEKQGNTNETTDNNELAQGVLRGVAINLITWIDYNAAEGNTCLSNIECKDIQDALVSGDWNKIYAYMKKKLEKQGEPKPVDKVEPKFKVGDTIIKKHNSDINKFGPFTITDISGGKYWYDESIICNIQEQDDWELVEQKSAKWNKDDEDIINHLLAICARAKRYRQFAGCSQDDIVKYQTWLKTLKERIGE